MKVAMVVIGPLSPEKVLTGKSVQDCLHCELNNCRHVHSIMKLNNEPSIRRVIEEETNLIVGYFVEYGPLKFELRKVKLVELDLE